MVIPDHLTCLLRNLYATQEATVKPNIEQQTGSKLGTEYIKAVYCHPVYLIYTFSHVWLFETPWTVASQAPLSMGFPRQEYWSMLPFPSPENLLNPRIKLVSLASPTLAGRFFTTRATWEALGGNGRGLINKRIGHAAIHGWMSQEEVAST